jgi:hypothetical protein
MWNKQKQAIPREENINFNLKKLFNYTIHQKVNVKHGTILCPFNWQKLVVILFKGRMEGWDWNFHIAEGRINQENGFVRWSGKKKSES